MKEHKYFFTCLFALTLLYVAGLFYDAGLDSIRSASENPQTPVLMAGFFGSIVGAIKKVGNVALKIAPVIPGVGQVIAGATAAVGALKSGGQVQTITPAAQPGGVPTVQTIGTFLPNAPALQQAGFGGDLMNFKLMGVPIVYLGFGAILIGFLVRRRK